MIDGAMRKVDMGRTFVRPSGTEDCVRVYAEARSTAEADGQPLLSNCTRLMRF